MDMVKIIKGLFSKPKSVVYDIGYAFDIMPRGLTFRDGDASAEKFLYTVLLPLTEQYDKIHLVFDHVEGIASNFLEYAFKHLVYIRGYTLADFKSKFTIDDEILAFEIEVYINDAQNTYTTT